MKFYIGELLCFDFSTDPHSYNYEVGVLNSQKNKFKSLTSGKVVDVELATSFDWRVDAEANYIINLDGANGKVFHKTFLEVLQDIISNSPVDIQLDSMDKVTRKEAIQICEYYNEQLNHVTSKSVSEEVQKFNDYLKKV